MITVERRLVVKAANLFETLASHLEDDCGSDDEIDEAREMMDKLRDVLAEV